jgi:bifunctional UDP-N-acetylglucosamine pyrophosphorylase/glucosamine-1-phosphate N-acetyltransferase
MIKRLINVSDQEGGEMAFSITLTPETSHSGVVYRDETGHVTRTVENPEPGVEQSNYVLSGLYLLQPVVLEQLEQTPDFAEAIHALIKGGTRIHTSVWEKEWAHLRYPWDLLELNRLHLNQIQETRIHRTAQVEGNVSIEHPVVIDSGAIVRPGATLRGPSYIGANAYIGNNCLIREYTNLDAHVQIGFSSEVKNALIMEHSQIGSLSYIGDSIIGMQTVLTAGITTMNTPIPPAQVTVQLNGETFQPNLKKLGAIVGNHTRISANVSTYPGVIIGARAKIGPGAIINRNIKADEEIHASTVQS